MVSMPWVIPRFRINPRGRVREIAEGAVSCKIAEVADSYELGYVSPDFVCYGAWPTYPCRSTGGGV